MIDPFLYERQARMEGQRHVAGVDEAGRGPLAGPVIAAAVILPDDFDPTGITDSKALTERRREQAYARIIDQALAFALAAAEPDEIDRDNILRATHLAMRRAVAGLALAPDGVLVDGLPVPGLHANCRNLIRGDALCLSIGAASILAKVHRDRLMRHYHERWPQYGFDRHKGYPSPAHLQALAQHGPCPIHRRTFGPVAQQILDFSG